MSFCILHQTNNGYLSGKGAEDRGDFPRRKFQCDQWMPFKEPWSPQVVFPLSSLSTFICSPVSLQEKSSLSPNNDHMSETHTPWHPCFFYDKLLHLLTMWRKIVWPPFKFDIYSFNSSSPPCHLLSNLFNKHLPKVARVLHSSLGGHHRLLQSRTWCEKAPCS